MKSQIFLQQFIIRSAKIFIRLVKTAMKSATLQKVKCNTSKSVFEFKFSKTQVDKYSILRKPDIFRHYKKG